MKNPENIVMSHNFGKKYKFKNARRKYYLSTIKMIDGCNLF